MAEKAFSMTASGCASRPAPSAAQKSARRAWSFGMVLSAPGRNAISAIFLFTARVIASIAQLRYVEHSFGGAYSGLTVVSNQVLLYVTLLELGLAQSAISFLYEPILQHDYEKTSALVVALRASLFRMILIGAVVAFPALALYARFLHSQVPFSTIVATLWLVALGAFGQLASVHLQAYLNAAESLRWVNLVLGGGYLLKTVVGLSLALHYQQYLLLPLTISLLTIPEFLALKFAFSRQFPEFRPTEWRWAAQSIRERARFALIHKVAGVAYYQSDFIILSLTAGLVAVKDYAQYQYISAALFSVIGTVSIALTSTFAYRQLSGQPNARFGQYTRLQFGAALLGAAAFFGYVFVASDIVHMAFGQAQALDQRVLALFGAVLFLNIVKIADDMMITARGAFRIGYGIPIVEVPVFITLGVLLSKRLGFPGILIASIVTNLLISVLFKGFFLAREVFDSTPGRWFASRGMNVGLALLIACPLIALHEATNLAFVLPGMRDAFWCFGTLLYGLVVVRVIALRSSEVNAVICPMEPKP